MGAQLKPENPPEWSGFPGFIHDKAKTEWARKLGSRTSSSRVCLFWTEEGGRWADFSLKLIILDRMRADVEEVRHWLLRLVCVWRGGAHSWVWIHKPGWWSLSCRSGWARPPERRTGLTVQRWSEWRRGARQRANGGASGDCLCRLPLPLPPHASPPPLHHLRQTLPPPLPPSLVWGSPASSDGTAPGPPGPPSPCRCRWGCCAAAGTGAGPSLWAAWGEDAGRLFRGAGGRSCSSAGSPAAPSTGRRSSSYNHSRCAAEGKTDQLFFFMSVQQPDFIFKMFSFKSSHIYKVVTKWLILK